MVAPWVQILRPAHWVKNLFVLAPLLFARQLFDPDLLVTALAAFAVFCILSSSVYIVNDVFDMEQDRAHPLKARRPVAAGRIKPRPAFLAGAALACLALAASFLLGIHFGCVSAGYLVLNLLYSRWLKRIAFVDAASIAAGFVLRVVGGALAIQVMISVWLVVCTFCLACLLAFGKRRHELETLRDASPGTRPALSGYSPRSLRAAEWAMAGVTVVSYILYTLAPGTVAKFGTYNLVWTLPLPALGILRYLRLVAAHRQQSPTEALVTDPATWAILAAWVGAVILVLYDVT